MKTKYTKEQISEAIAYWTKQLDESEDEYSLEGQMPVASARSLIWNVNKDIDVKSSEYNFRMKTFSGIDVPSDDIVKTEDMCRHDIETYRPFVYYVPAESVKPYDNEKLKRFSDAFEIICEYGDGDEQSYNEFVNREFESYDPSEWDDQYFEDFKTAFPSYSAFINAVSEVAKRKLVNELNKSNSPLRYVDAEQIKVTSAGDAYVIVMWRS